MQQTLDQDSSATTSATPSFHQTPSRITWASVSLPLKTVTDTVRSIAQNRRLINIEEMGLMMLNYNH